MQWHGEGRPRREAEDTPHMYTCTHVHMYTQRERERERERRIQFQLQSLATLPLAQPSAGGVEWRQWSGVALADLSNPIQSNPIQPTSERTNVCIDRYGARVCTRTCTVLHIAAGTHNTERPRGAERTRQKNSLHPFFGRLLLWSKEGEGACECRGWIQGGGEKERTATGS